jgi:chromosome partitioning protein
MITTIVFYSSKGGVGKSTLCKYTARELTRLGYTTSLINLDQQQHIDSYTTEGADYTLIDTAGFYDAKTIQLLDNIGKTPQGVLIVVPTGTGKNDREELDFVLGKLSEKSLQRNTSVVLSRTRPNSKALTTTQEVIHLLGFNYNNWVFPLLEDFSEHRDTSRTRNEISSFLVNTVFRKGAL